MEVLTDPFPHIWLDAGMPAGLYAATECLWPDDVTARRKSVHKGGSIALTGGRLGVAPDFIKWDGKPTGDVWEAVMTLNREVLAPQLLAAFDPWVREHVARVRDWTRWRDASVQSLAANDGRLMIRWPGYRLRAHTDIAPYAITVLHYYARPDEDDESGTRLYTVPSPMPIRSLNEPLTQYFEDYGITPTLAKTMPWKANGMLAFPNTRMSAHGLMPRGTSARRAYQWHIGLPGATATKNFAKQVM